MTEELRHYCRHPRCRSKLKEPVENPREAFCARGCHTSFYRKRCMACEQPMERKREGQQLCGRQKCESQLKTLKAYLMLGRFHPSTPPKKADSDQPQGAAVEGSGNPIKPGTFLPVKTDRGWRQVAGPVVDVRLAAIRADDGLKHADRVNRGHWRDAGNAAAIQHHHAPVNVVGGYKFPDAPAVDIMISKPTETTNKLVLVIETKPGEMPALPSFLDRRSEAPAPDSRTVHAGVTREAA
jgi:hypothetical protein